jgi:hypothetical protein
MIPAVFLRILVRFLLPAALGATIGFFALAFAIENEPVYTTASLAAVSPGLQVAELITPAKHESMAATFGNFLRVGLAVNGVYYFLIFAAIAYLIDRRIIHSRRSSNSHLQN